MAYKDLSLVKSEMLTKQDQTNNTLQKFMEISIRQFDEQVKFNNLFLKEIKGVRVELVGVNQRLDKVEATIFKLAEFDDRLKRLEAIVLKP